MTGSEIAGWIVTAFVGYQVFSTVRDACQPRHVRMAKRCRDNAKRGIFMRPGWWYRNSDGSAEMSPTGRLEDAVVREQNGLVRPATASDVGTREEMIANFDRGPRPMSVKHRKKLPWFLR